MSQTEPTVAQISRETQTRAYGRLSDGTPFEVVRHLGSGRFEIRHFNGIGKSRKYNTLTSVQRAVIAAHPITHAVRSAKWRANSASPQRSTACLVVNAAPGEERAARGLMGRAIRATLGVRQWKQAPHFVAFYARDSYGPGFDPRFTVEVTDAEFTKLVAAAARLALAEGWDRSPFDCYLD